MTEYPDDCCAALAKVYAFLDGELDETEADAIRHHLDACEPCLDHYDVEQALRSLVRRCCSGQHAPESLRLRVITQIHQSWSSSTHIEVTGTQVEVTRVEIRDFPSFG